MKKEDYEPIRTFLIKERNPLKGKEKKEMQNLVDLFSIMLQEIKQLKHLNEMLIIERKKLKEKNELLQAINEDLNKQKKEWLIDGSE